VRSIDRYVTSKVVRSDANFITSTARFSNLPILKQHNAQIMKLEAAEITRAGNSLRSVTHVATCTRCISASFEFALTMKSVAISRLILKRNSKLPVARKCRFSRSGTCYLVLIQIAPRENDAHSCRNFPRHFAKTIQRADKTRISSWKKIAECNVKFCLCTFIYSLS